MDWRLEKGTRVEARDTLSGSETGLRWNIFMRGGRDRISGAGVHFDGAGAWRCAMRLELS